MYNKNCCRTVSFPCNCHNSRYNVDRDDRYLLQGLSFPYFGSLLQIYPYLINYSFIGNTLYPMLIYR
jgi:Rieske Fe-S protein